VAPPIVALVGKSGSGKTTLVEKLLRVLSGRGIKVATIKHDAHSFELDTPGKDSWRHRQAGAAAVAVASAGRLFLTVNLAESESGVREIIERYFPAGQYDIVLLEGYKSGDTEKIEVHRTARSDELLCNGVADRLVAVASDRQWDLGVPVFELDDVASLADFIVRRYLPGRDSGGRGAASPGDADE